MSNLYPLLCLAPIGALIFVIGVLIGYTIKNSYRYRLLLNQNRGEASVRTVIVSKFQPPNFHLLNNVTLPFQDGTTQIDHILISTKGVFVLATAFLKSRNESESMGGASIEKASGMREVSKLGFGKH